MTTPDKTNRGIPAWKLERFVLGELPAADLQELNERLQTDTELRQRVDALRSTDAEIRAAYPAPWMARQIQARADAASGTVGDGSGWAWMDWRLAAPLAVAALLAVVALPTLQQNEAEAPARFIAEGVRSKGVEATLYVHRRTQNGTEQLHDGSAARRGDLLRLQYRVAPESAQDGASVYGAILSVDGSGAVTRHLPVQGDVAVPLTSGDVVSLDAAYELDDAPHWERFVLITGPQPFTLGPVLAAAQAAVPAATRSDASQLADAAPILELPAALTQMGLRQTGLTLTKVPAVSRAPAGTRVPTRGEGERQ